MSFADDKVKERHCQQSKGCNSKINDPIQTVFELIWDFIHVPLNCKFHEDPIKTEQVMLMLKSNRDFFSNHGDVTLGIMIWSGQVSNSSENSSLSALSASFKKILNEILITVKQTLFQQSRGFNSKIRIWSVQVSNLCEISSMSTLSASFMKIWLKLKELFWWQTEAFSAIRGM